jgi:hypothetical protein
MWVRMPRVSTALVSLTLFTALLATFGCGGGGTDPGNGGGGTGPIPTVLSAAPGEGASNVGTNADIFAIFSTEMNASTINANTFTLSGGVSATVTYDAAHRTAILHPNGSLAAGTQYTATVSTAAMSSGGKHLNATFVWTFTTAAADSTPPTVLSNTTPAQNSTNVALNTVIKFPFSEPMNTTTFPSTWEIALDATHSVFMTPSWNSTGTELSLTPPASGLPPGVYDISPAALIPPPEDVAGNPLTPFTLHFSTVTN